MGQRKHSRHLDDHRPASPNPTPRTHKPLKPKHAQLVVSHIRLLVEFPEFPEPPPGAAAENEALAIIY